MVAATTRAGTHPFILYGDFNVTPAELEASGFPSTVDVVVYRSNTYTCELDGVRSNIDFFWCHVLWCRSWISCRSSAPSPLARTSVWSSH